MHATGLFNSMGALLGGGRVVTARPGGLDAEHVWRTAAAKDAGMVIVAGNTVCRPLADELVAAERRGTPHDLTKLRSVLSSGTALSDELKEIPPPPSRHHHHRRHRLQRGRAVCLRQHAFHR